MAFHLAGGKPEPVAKARTAARARAPRLQGSLLGGFATSQWWLLTARAIQGVGGAVIAPTALALISTNFPKARNATGRLASTRRWPAPVPRRAWCSADC
jgi:MFS family permease